MDELNAEIVRSPQEWEALIPRIREFIQKQSGHSLFHSPDFLASVFCNLGENRSAHYTIITQSRSDNREEIVGLAPFLRIDGDLALKFGVFSLLRFRLPRLVLLSRAPLIASDADHAAITNYLLGFLKSQQVNLIGLDCLELESAWFGSLETQSRSKSFPYRLKISPAQALRSIRFEGDFESYLGHMAKKTRYNLRRAVSQFEKKSNECARVECVSSPDQVKAFLDSLDYVYNRSWQASLYGGKKRNSDNATLQYTVLAESGLLRSFILYKGEEAIAFIRGFQYANHYYYEEIGYVQDYRGLEPGTVLNFLAIKMLFEHSKPDCLDFGFGENDYKRKFGNHETTAATANLLVPASKAGLILGLSSILNTIYRALSALARRLQLEKRLRNWIKHKRN